MAPAGGQCPIKTCRARRFGIACRALQTTDFSEETLTRLHRFAALLFGRSGDASAAILDAARQCGGHLDQLRREKQSLAFLVRTLRDARAKAGAASGSAADDPAEPGQALATAFSQLPEPERSALALLYSDLFPFAEIANLLNLDVHDLAEKLGSARRMLAEKWRPQPPSEPS